MLLSTIKKIDREQITEIQRFSIVWVVLLSLILICVGVMLAKGPGGLYQSQSLMPIVIIIMIIILLGFSHLSLQVDEKSVCYRFFPFHLRFRSIAKSEISKIEIRDFDPVSDFGGWGIRYDFGKKRFAYIIKGKRGILVTRKDGRQLIVGTQVSESELESFFARHKFPV